MPSFYVILIIQRITYHTLQITSDLHLFCHKKESGRTYPSVYGRMAWDEPSPTITTQFYGYGNGRFEHPEQNRAISMREGAMLQSFPGDYVFLLPIQNQAGRN
jgi:site-specific DNA-cytosine methylase